MRAAKSISLCFAVAVAISLSASCAPASHGGSSQSHLPVASMIIAASEDGVVLAQGNPAGTAQSATTLKCIDRSGRVTFSTRCTSFYECQSRAPALAVATAEGQQPERRSENMRLIAVDAAGRVRFSREFKDTFVLPLSWDGRSLVYVCLTSRGCIVRRIGRESSSSLELPWSSSLASWSASEDGTRIALVFASHNRFRLVWLSVASSGRPVLTGSARVVNPYVSLAPSGACAVLGGSKPQLVAFARYRGRPIPDNYVSQAILGDRRMWLLTAYSKNDVPVRRYSVYDYSLARLLTGREHSGVDVFHLDPRIESMSWVAVDSGRSWMRDLTSGAIFELATGLDDVAPVSRTLMVTARGQSVSFLQSPLPPD